MRVVAPRACDRDNGKQIHLWDYGELTAPFCLTNDTTSDAYASPIRDRVAPEGLAARGRHLRAATKRRPQSEGRA